MYIAFFYMNKNIYQINEIIKNKYVINITIRINRNHRVIAYLI